MEGSNAASVIQRKSAEQKNANKSMIGGMHYNHPPLLRNKISVAPVSDSNGRRRTICSRPVVGCTCLSSGKIFVTACECSPRVPASQPVKPDGNLDGHPASWKWILFEAFAKNIIELAQSNPEQWAETAIFVTVDEGGGFYDSGFIQPVDFFGTGPRIPMIAVSPFSTGGHISHVYSEHSSFVKFIERNWMLNTTLSSRSRDNLPNPVQNANNSYVPRNMPAIGDLFDLFNFQKH